MKFKFNHITQEIKKLKKYFFNSDCIQRMAIFNDCLEKNPEFSWAKLFPLRDQTEKN